MLFGPDGLPVVSSDRRRVLGWVTQHDLTSAMAENLAETAAQTPRSTLSAEWGDPAAESRLHDASDPLGDYVISTIRITPESGLAGCHVQDVELPDGALIAGLTSESRSVAVSGETVLRSGDRVHLVVPGGIQ